MARVDGRAPRSRARSAASPRRCSPRLGLLVATRDRAARLERLLASLASEWGDVDEAVFVDNGSQDGTADLLARAARDNPRIVVATYAAPGKARALNHGLRLGAAALVGFLDDDVRVLPGWAAAMRAAAASSDAPAFQGRIVPPREIDADPALAAAWRLWGTLPTVVGASPRRPALTGANMAVRRSAFERVGGFDERLGPGAYGLCEDTELAWRLQSELGPPAFAGDASVEHEWDPERLTAAYFNAYHRRLGRSRYAHKRNRLVSSILPNLAKATLLSIATRPLGADRRHLRQRARWIQYREMLRAWAEERGAPPPAQTPAHNPLELRIQ